MPGIPKGVGTGSRRRVLDFLLANIGRVITSDEIRAASGNASEWARRLRELRDQFGYRILTHKDRRDLKPGQYLLEDREPSYVFAARTISKETRAFVLERNGYTCQMCGLGAGDPDPYNTARKVRLTMGHIIDLSKGGTDSRDNLRAICTNCNEGLQNIAPPKPKRIELMKQVRRATIDDQLFLLEWLEGKFRKIRPKKPPRA